MAVERRCFVCRAPLEPRWDDYVKAHLHVCPSCGRKYSPSLLQAIRADTALANAYKRWGFGRAAREGRR